MSKITFSHDALILDTGPLINLYGSQKIDEILAIIPVPVFVVAYVKKHEARYIYSKCPKDMAKPSEPIELQPIIDCGLLGVVDIENESEADLVVDLSIMLDDGEARTAAVAYHRNWAIAIDEKNGRRILSKEMSQLQLINTLEILKYWAVTTQADEATLKTTLENVYCRGRYRPPQDHPLTVWWNSYVSPNSGL